MKTSHNPLARFGQDPADSENLVRCWRETRPVSESGDWSSFWYRAQTAAEFPNAQPKPGAVAGNLRWVLAASVAAGLCLSWSLGAFDRKDPLNGRVVQSTEPNREIQKMESTFSPVSIEFDENDDLAVIRLDDEQCPSENPCMESVENYVIGESNETALASNFLLFNELEAIAAD